MQIWKDGKRENAQKLINWLLSRRGTEGWKVDSYNTIAFAELVYSANQAIALTESTVMQILNKMLSTGKNSIDDFESLFADQKKQNAIIQNKNTQPWQIYIPLHLHFTANTRRPIRMRLLGTHFEIISKKGCQKEIGKPFETILKPVQFLTKIQVGQVPENFIKFVVYGGTIHEAVNQIETVFDTLRGLMEVTFGLGSWRIISTRPKPRRKIPHPTWIIYQHSDNGPLATTLNTDDIETPASFEITKEGMNAVKQNAKLLSHMPPRNSTLSIVADGLRLYSQAMDARWTYASFLGLWQL